MRSWSGAEGVVVVRGTVMVHRTQYRVKIVRRSRLDASAEEPTGVPVAPGSDGQIGILFLASLTVLAILALVVVAILWPVLSSLALAAIVAIGAIVGGAVAAMRGATGR
jgi:hypothetical protein